MEQTKNHIVNIDNRNALSASGISDVTSFNEREVRLTLCGGGKMVISGDAMKIDGFSKQTGEVRIGGRIYAVKYSDMTIPSVKKFFK